MSPIIFSVVIPAYNNADFIGEAIQSVLDQTYPNYEIIVVNDASPDNASDVVRSFNDPRVILIEHPVNRGLSAARNTGILAAKGEWIALLDGDDIFHPQKLETHAEFITNHPDIGVTYNSRFELNHSAKTIRELWRPPLTVSLFDLTMGFPFSPSDMVVSRDWLIKVDLFDVKHLFVGEDLDINVKLALAGCTFANVDRALNYRRYHSRRKYNNLRSYFRDTLQPLEDTFSDERCPKDVLSKKDLAYAQHTMLWSIVAFIEEDSEFGQELCLKAIELNPLLIQGFPSPYLETIMQWAIMDVSADHTQLLRDIFHQLPSKLDLGNSAYDWAISQGFFIKGIRSIIWTGDDTWQEFLSLAAQNGTKLTLQLRNWISAQLVNYEHEYGREKTKLVLDKLADSFTKIGWKPEVRSFKASYYISRAFHDYGAGKFSLVPNAVLLGLVNNPKLFSNRGVFSILIKSLVNSYRISTGKH